jgi:hypothetical protein
MLVTKVNANDKKQFFVTIEIGNKLYEEIVLEFDDEIQLSNDDSKLAQHLVEGDDLCDKFLIGGLLKEF